MRYRYEGPGPQEDGTGHLVHPGDVRGFEQEPGWGPWEPVADEPEDGAESPAGPSGTQSPAPAPDRPPAASGTPGTATPANPVLAQDSPAKQVM